MSTFKRAERTRVKPKIAITGPSGSGKTMGALILATTLGKKIAVVDTENESASTYADRFTFDTLSLGPPYTVDKFIHAVNSAIREGYDVVIIDSASHEWAGDGGLLSRKEDLDSVKGSNHFANWAPISKDHERFKALIMNADITLIATMRSKQDYVLSANEKGKQAPEKVGLAPIQREGMEYEFMTCFDIDMNHTVTVSKDRTSLFDGRRFKITSNIGQELVDWLASAKPAPAVEPPKGDTDVPDFKPLTQVPSASGVACSHCGAQVVPHSTKSGYVCPNAKDKADPHTRFLNSALAEKRKTQPYTPAAQGA